ncbi:hypothetical protein MRX96_029778 [Rhipicephalus microplus]
MRPARRVFRAANVNESRKRLRRCDSSRNSAKLTENSAPRGWEGSPLGIEWLWSTLLSVTDLRARSAAQLEAWIFTSGEEISPETRGITVISEVVRVAIAQIAASYTVFVFLAESTICQIARVVV